MDGAHVLGPSPQMALALEELTALLDRVEAIENTVRNDERKRLWRRIAALCAAVAQGSAATG